MDHLKRQILHFLIVSLLAGFSSCRKEPDFPNWDANLFAPIIKTELDLSNLLPDSVISENPNNTLTLAYTNTFYGLTADSLVELPDTTMSYDYLVPAGYIVVYPATPLINQTTQNNYQLNGIQITRAIVRSGYMKVYVRNTVNKRMKVTYTIPCATKNTIPFSKTVIVPAAIGNNAGQFLDTFRLDGYSLDLRGPNLNSYNIMTSTVDALVDPTEIGSDTVFAGQGVEVDVSLLDMIPQYAKGYFGQNNFQVGPDSSFLSLFSHITSGTLLLEDAQVKLTIENFIGADARITLQNLTSINSRTNDYVSLNHPVINSTINITRAVDNNGVITPDVYTILFNPQNSNIKTMLENMPDWLTYSLYAEVNPLGNVSLNNDFIYYGKGLNAKLEMDIPFSFASDDLTLADTVPFSAIDPEKNNVKEGTLTLFADNGFPFDCSIQVTMLDASGNNLGNLMPVTNTIDEAPVNQSLIVTQPKLTRINIPVSTATMDKLELTRNLIVTAKFNTSAYPNYIKIYNYYKIKVQVVGDFIYNVSLR